MADRNSAVRPTARPPVRPTASIKALNVGPREISGENLAVVLAGSGAAHRPPLAHPHAMPPPRADGDQTRDLPAVLRNRQPKRRAAEQLICPGAEHGANVGPRHADVAVLERDAQ